MYLCMYVCMYVWIILLNLNIAQLILTFYKRLKNNYNNKSLDIDLLPPLANIYVWRKV